MPDSLAFEDFLHPRPATSGLDAICKLQHFSIITYAVDPSRFKRLFPPRFKLDTVTIDGHEKGLVSIVPFVEVDFTSAVIPFPNFTMGQTDYRVYIIDRATGERCVWSLGTILDSWTLAVPRHLWKLPWHHGSITFECDFDTKTSCYTKYSMRTKAEWAPARVELTQKPEQDLELPGFPDTETGLVYLTHPLAGFHHRRDGRLGTYRVWHKRLKVRPASLLSANFGLLTRMGLVTDNEQKNPHSILVEPINEITIYLPPSVINSEI